MAAQHSRYGDYSTRYKFNGKEQDEATGFYYYGARYYEPSLSRWLSTDPLAEKYQDFSPYNYTLNNPINLVDPDGMQVGDPVNGIKVLISKGTFSTKQFVEEDYKREQTATTILSSTITYNMYDDNDKFLLSASVTRTSTYRTTINGNGTAISETTRTRTSSVVLTNNSGVVNTLDDIGHSSKTASITMHNDLVNDVVSITKTGLTYVDKAKIRTENALKIAEYGEKTIETGLVTLATRSPKFSSKIAIIREGAETVIPTSYFGAMKSRVRNLPNNRIRAYKKNIHQNYTPFFNERVKSGENIFGWNK